MTVPARQVYTEALHLPPLERAELVELILSSFHFKERAAIDAAWADEAESRIDAFDQGKIQAHPIKQMFASIQK
jgi:putative addiction module component (TIGR02574 family)